MRIGVHELAAKRPRLLVLASTYPARSGDGVPAFVEDLAQMQSSEFDVTVLVPQVPGAARAEVSPAGVKVRRFRYFPSRWEDLADGAIIENLRARPSRWLQVVPLMVSEAFATAKAYLSFRPDVVHAHWIIPQGLVATIATPGVPRLVTSLGGDLYALNAKPMRLLKSWVVKKAQALSAVNADMAEAIVELGADPDHVSVIPMGADLSRFNPSERQASLDGTLRLLFVGRLVEKKGVEVLLDAVRLVNAGGIQVDVVGTGPLEAALKEQATGLPVRFLGQRRRDELAKDYSSHDVIVVPSVRASSGDQDGLPVALLEAMGSGCAVIASDLPGINEAVQDGESGILVPAGDATALAEAIVNLKNSPPLLEALSAGAAASAVGYSVENTSKKYLSILKTIMRK